MAVDYGSRDPAFVAMSDAVRHQLAALVGPAEGWVAVPVQGSGTFAIEAAVGTLIPRDGKLLVVENGAYGARLAQIATTLGVAVARYAVGEDTQPDPGEVDRLLAADASITHVGVIVCETTTGIRNPVAEIARVVAHHGRSLLLDAMSAFGVFPLSAADLQFDALVASSNKCLEGPPGMGFVVVRREVLAACRGRARSVALDLYAQQQRFEVDGQWRFTPPTHIVAATAEALAVFHEEGGVNGRSARYAENHRVLVDGMRNLGFETLLPDDQMSPIIVTFREPAHAAWSFDAFYDALRDDGFVIYPGKLTTCPSFRVGCIGQVYPDDMRAFLASVERWMSARGLPSGAPAR
jgi:2-aminoethylphosphonate-pyruvate transaminase